MDFSGVTNTINRLTSAVERLTEVIIASTPFVQRQSDDTAPVNPVQMVESAPTSPSIHQLKISLHTEEDVESIRSREAQGSSPGKPEPTIAALKKVEPPFGTLLTAELGKKGKLLYLKFREPLDRDQAFHRAGDIRQALDLSLGCEVVPPTYTFRYKGVSHNDVKGYEGRLLDTKLRNLNPGVEIQSITYRLGMLLLNVVGWNSHNIVLEKGVVLLAPDAEGGKHLAVEKFDLKTLPIFCYRCWEPAPKHRKPTCTKALACGECGGDHDSYLAGECTAGFKKCINCFRRYEAGDTTIKYDHPAWADDCKHPDTVKMRRACRKHAKRDLEETTRQPRKTRGSTSEPVSTNTSGSTTAQGPLRSALAESENTSFRPGHNLIPPSERESAAASRKKQAKTRGKRTKSVAFNADGGSLPSQDSKSKLSNNAEDSGNTMKRRKPDQPDPSPAGPPADPQQSSLADFWPKRRS